MSDKEENQKVLKANPNKSKTEHSYSNTNKDFLVFPSHKIIVAQSSDNKAEKKSFLSKESIISLFGIPKSSKTWKIRGKIQGSKMNAVIAIVGQDDKGNNVRLSFASNWTFIDENKEKLT